MSGLRVEDAVIRYQDTVAVDRVSLEVSPGEIVALLGPSGCGKSSLLRAVAGLEPLASGSMSWDGADLAGVPTHRRGFGLIFQDGQLFPHRSVAGNVAYGIASLPRTERAARVEELLDLVGLSGYGRRRVTQLSGGQAQRVALARSLAPRPRLLLLDEPLSALDRALRERLATDLDETLRATHTTGLYVTHDQDEAFTVADRVAVMDLGRLLQVDTPERLWAAPANRRVAEFLGYKTFLPGTDGRLRAIEPSALRVSGVSGVSPDGPEGAGESLGADVLGRRVLRGAVEWRVRLDDGQVAFVHQPQDEAAESAERLRLSVDPAGVHPIG